MEKMSWMGIGLSGVLIAFTGGGIFLWVRKNAPSFLRVISPSLELRWRLEEAKKEAEQREYYLLTVSHDLKNPLTSISLNAQLILNSIDPHSTTHGLLKKNAEAICEAADYMKHLIENILDLARIERGHLRINSSECSIREVLDSVIRLHSLQASEKGIQLTRSFFEEFEFYCDRNLMIQALSNLVGNALKFTPRDGVITLGALLQDGAVLIWVRDTGRGIEKEKLELIFQKFSQVDPEGNSGLGLGLAITRHLVESHGGRIWTESQLGRGSTFYIKLPQMKAGVGPSHAEVKESGTQVQKSA